MISSSSSRPPADNRHPIVVLASDDRFAMPLATTVRSLLEHLSPEVTLRMFILDGGIRDETRQRLLRSWPRGRFEVEWLRVDESALAGSPVSGHVNLVSYYRILIPRLLPPDIERVIYLDSDLLIRADLSRMWALDLSDRLCLAVQDCSAPYMDSSQTLANYEVCRPYLGCNRPVPNFRELGLAPQAAYFNAGVLLINLAAWREEDLSRQLIDCLDRNKDHVRWWDQYAMNVVLSGRWGAMDARWNQGSHIYRYPSWQKSPYDRASFEQQRDDPYLVHFTTRHKPWRASCQHPLQADFFACMERTDWSGWQMPRVDRMLEALKVPERKFRHGRRWLVNQAKDWFQPGRRKSA